MAANQDNCLCNPNTVDREKKRNKQNCVKLMAHTGTF